MSKYESLLNDCEADVRAGQAHLAAKRLGGLNVSQVPRELRLRFANVARRASLFALGMRLLAPLIHPDRNKWRAEATSEELAEYAVLLQKFGVIKEALQTLERVDTKKVPEAHLYKTFCYFPRWEYEAAIPCLEAYLASGLSPYSALVGKVNLAAAFVETQRLDRALALLNDNIETARAGNHHRLQGNCLEMRAQVHLRQSEFARAQLDLEEAEKLFGSERTLDQLFVQKWKAILEGLRTGKAEPILRFRAEAVARPHWESVRESDFSLLKINFDEKAFEHLVAGTPFASYRARICRELGRTPQHDVYVLGEKSARHLDVRTGELSGSEALNPGRKLHQLIEILSRDLYRPVRLGALFTELFPGEYFDIHSSPDRVHQILRRTRRWLDGERIPLEVLEAGGNYSLKIAGEFALHLPLERSSIESHSLLFERLKQAYPSMSFSAREARERLELPLTSFNRLINWAIAAELVVRRGSGPKTRYEVLSETQARNAA